MRDEPIGFYEYQVRSQSFVMASIANEVGYFALGLTGEAGEIANKVKKMIRDGVSTEDMRASIEGELGDVLWYLARLADQFDLTLVDVAEANLEKLSDRAERGVIGGNGDNR